MTKRGGGPGSGTVVSDIRFKRVDPEGPSWVRGKISVSL